MLDAEQIKTMAASRFTLVLRTNITYFAGYFREWDILLHYKIAYLNY